jgi:hypothetical protein
MEGLLSHKQMFLLSSSPYVSAQIGLHQVILEECTNGDGMHINSNATIKFLLVPLNTIYTFDFKLRLDMVLEF